MLSTRATLLAKQVTATRPRRPRSSTDRLWRTSFSLPEWPSTMALVESQTIASTPRSPSAARAASSVGGPISGVGSIFQSPVCRTMPCGVSIASAWDSGMECAMRMKRSLKGARSMLPPGGTMWIFTWFSSCASISLRRRKAAANGVA